MEKWSDFVPHVEVQFEKGQTKKSQNSERKVDVIFQKNQIIF